MDRQAFLNEIATALEVDVALLKDDFELTKDNWDSLAQVSVMLVLDEYSTRKVAVEELSACKTVADIVALLGPA